MLYASLFMGTKVRFGTGTLLWISLVPGVGENGLEYVPSRTLRSTRTAKHLTSCSPSSYKHTLSVPSITHTLIIPRENENLPELHADPFCGTFAIVSFTSLPDKNWDIRHFVAHC